MNRRPLPTALRCALYVAFEGGNHRTAFLSDIRHRKGLFWTNSWNSKRFSEKCVTIA